MWRDNFGNQFATREEAYADAMKVMTLGEYALYLFEDEGVPNLSFMKWLFEETNFREHFNEDVKEAEDRYFNDWYEEVKE